MIPRFYCPVTEVTLLTQGRVLLPAAQAHHALKVLRLRVGDALVLFDGQGGEYPGCIVEATRQVVVSLGAWQARESESPLQVTLAQGLPGGDKMDWVVQKAVELGVAAIQPLEMKRSVVRLAGERAEKRQAHWQQVAVAACEQSGRNRLPEVKAITGLPKYLAAQASNTDATLRLLLSPHRGQPLSSWPRPTAGVTLLIGPEGGMDADEETLACTLGFQPVSLGPRVLRTETAGLAALAALMALWGDF
ncbi:MAG: 16S rRNA (uracil(1498)-N(3))-methyltransferase [Sterolibacterium sp.]|jgi:16S rRNA (uracil1498-N3)-methyltransferase|nr:16S rRNA (uracil(1498)-N(3))-methyltransferase [Sterolibacterium sp.]